MTPAAIPLTAAFATAQPGCTLHVQPDFVDLLFANGSAAYGFAIPDSPALAGAVFRHQVVAHRARCEPRGDGDERARDDGRNILTDRCAADR